MTLHYRLWIDSIESGFVYGGLEDFIFPKIMILQEIINVCNTSNTDFMLFNLTLYSPSKGSIKYSLSIHDL